MLRVLWVSFYFFFQSSECKHSQNRWAEAVKYTLGATREKKRNFPNVCPACFAYICTHTTQAAFRVPSQKGYLFISYQHQTPLIQQILVFILELSIRQSGERRTVISVAHFYLSQPKATNTKVNFGFNIMIYICFGHIGLPSVMASEWIHK